MRSILIAVILFVGVGTALAQPPQGGGRPDAPPTMIRLEGNTYDEGGLATDSYGVLLSHSFGVGGLHLTASFKAADRITTEDDPTGYFPKRLYQRAVMVRGGDQHWMVFSALKVATDDLDEESDNPKVVGGAMRTVWGTQTQDLKVGVVASNQQMLKQLGIKTNVIPIFNYRYTSEKLLVMVGIPTMIVYNFTPETKISLKTESFQGAELALEHRFPTHTMLSFGFRAEFEEYTLSDRTDEDDYFVYGNKEVRLKMVQPLGRGLRVELAGDYLVNSEYFTENDSHKSNTVDLEDSMRYSAAVMILF